MAIQHDYRRPPQTLRAGRRHLLDQYRFVASRPQGRGVGSVGTDAWIVLSLDRDDGSPLLLQMKEAEASVLEPFTTERVLEPRARVVAGQRLMQSASDIFLGWERSWDGATRDYYIRQLRDWKGSADDRGMTPAGMELWGDVRLDARPRPRSVRRPHRDRVVPRQVRRVRPRRRRVLHAYADQNERDYLALRDAVGSGRLAAEAGV